MTKACVREAEGPLTDLVEHVLAGEDVIISQGGRPVARVIPYQPQTKRPRGVWRGKVTIAEDFDQLPEEVAKAFRGETP